MDFRTFQDGMFPKWRRLFLCRAQILPSGSHFPVDLKERVWYDNGVGSDFSGLFFVSLFQPVGTLLPGGEPARPVNPDTRGRVSLHSYPHQEMTPDIRRGSFLFLGFNHWVTSLSAGSTGLFCLVGIPSAAFMFFSVRCDWHLCKTEDVESPAGRCTYHIWYHLFSYHQSTTPQGFLQDGKQHK